ncbi:MAG: hypothetical protein NVSMB6_29720 [Burkholderiaceae bacterium]
MTHLLGLRPLMTLPGHALGEVFAGHQGAPLRDRVMIMPSDSGSDPVERTLVPSAAERYALERADERVGGVTIYFPKLASRCGKSERSKGAFLERNR